MKSLLFVAALASAAPVAAADVAALAKIFGARETVSGVRLSPSGDRIVYLTPSGARGLAVVVAEVATGNSTVLLTSDKGTIVPQYCGWKTEARVLCSVYYIQQAYGRQLSFQRTVSIPIDRSPRIELGQRQIGSDIDINQDGARVIDWLPDDPEHVLMQVFVPEKSTIGSIAISRASGTSVQKVDVNTGAMTMVENPDPNAFSFDSDDQGRVRFRSLGDRSATGYMRNSVSYYLRGKASREWRRLGTDTLSGLTKFTYLGFDETADNIFTTRDKDGRAALYLQPAEGDGEPALVFAHPHVDVDRLLRIGRNNRAVAAVYTTDTTQYTYFDKVLERRTKALSSALPGKPPVVIYDESWDGKRNLVFAGGVNDPGAYYRFDTGTRKMEMLLPVRPEMAEITLGTQTSLSYPASDGVKIPAYLTLPPGVASMKGLPAIVMPHGGPSARDEQAFDWLAQFFAQAGYAVLQPNYRGSTGYGADWYAENGFKSWPIAIGDVNAGAHWMIAQGADPAKMAIFGWSYGGYAALQASSVEPALYKAVVAVAPVTDLALLKQNSIGFSNYPAVAAEIGAGPHVSAGSPTRNADKIIAPVLMFQGDRDQNVDISQARAMDAALNRAGKKHELVVYPGLQHSLVDSAVRTEMLQRSEAWISAAIGK